MRYLVVALLLGVTPGAVRAETCPQHFASGIAPAISTAGTPLCFEQFAVLYSGETRTPLWSAEHLTRDEVAAAGLLKRENAFHQEPRLPPDEQSRLDDYHGSGYDRGHMSPSGDMATIKAQYESFSLANMIPQNPCNNEVLWEGIESAVRGLATADGELYVVTGPIYEGADIPFLNGRVAVPSRIFKAVYDPARHEAAAYVVQNTASMDWQSVSVGQLTAMTGIDPFPALSGDIKSETMALPTPRSHFGCRVH
jgi:endonuclease G, mitochondrial